MKDAFHRVYSSHTYMRCRYDRPGRGMIILMRRIARRRLARTLSEELADYDPIGDAAMARLDQSESSAPVEVER